MFKKIEDVSNINPLNKTAQKKLREKIIDAFPLLESVLDDFMPKKCTINSQKFYTQEHKYELFWVEKFPAFFKNDKEDELFPTVRLIHMYPDFLPRMQTDSGAIKFILNGSNVMSKGLQTQGAFIDESVQNRSIVAVYAQGKEHAMGVGKCTMNAQGIREAEIGEGIIMYHIIGDQLWLLQEPKKK
ncbi:hypothetical protein IMG5_047070 [Ichthyophthirius multifiliis]|uniref:PUA domain-containing protein n=1 Tax=Ichthyophthirius multifiliis TaxID=5932 RepID=G0QMA4_ICHMU|nr:hypothetical protein IMG5_047070 [Ichthyophthirius multifiliis]EGR33661.1 hypothetical protein IMG5_047070 [Ichthyophthirius multifiliis]|eukprot:XP_004037647.1 hypothetical protein IMG5_047070 [Ichthyophthirius multifiliis]